MPWKQWRCNLCWKGRDRAQSFVLMFALQLNILTGTFLLVSCSNIFQNLFWICTVKGKNANKNITKKFARLHNHCLLLTENPVNFLSGISVNRLSNNRSQLCILDCSICTETFVNRAVQVVGHGVLIRVLEVFVWSLATAFEVCAKTPFICFLHFLAGRWILKNLSSPSYFGIKTGKLRMSWYLQKHRKMVSMAISYTSKNRTDTAYANITIA